MAVVRIVFPDRGAVKSAADAAEMAGLTKAATEIRRIVIKNRPGMMAELSAEEALRLGEVAGQVFPRIQQLLRDKAEEGRRAIEFDREELARRRARGDRIRERIQGGGAKRPPLAPNEEAT